MLITGYQFISMLCDMNKNSEKPEYYLDKVKLTGLIRDRHIADYSFEEKKRLQLAAFLIQKPYVMMLLRKLLIRKKSQKKWQRPENSLG